MDTAHSNKVVLFIPRNHLLKRHLPGIHVSTRDAALCDVVVGFAAFKPELAIIICLTIMAFDSFKKETKVTGER